MSERGTGHWVINIVRVVVSNCFIDYRIEQVRNAALPFLTCSTVETLVSIMMVIIKSDLQVTLRLRLD